MLFTDHPPLDPHGLVEACRRRWSVPSTTSGRLPGRWIAVVVAVLFTATACASTPDPAPPALEASTDATQARIQSLEAFDHSVRTDLERLEVVGDDLSQMIHRASRGELPLSLLRLVTLNCLNSEYDGDTSDSGLLDGTTLTCEPAHAEGLIQQLDTVSTAARDDAHRLLYLADQARLLRGSLRRRLARLPDTANDHLDFIADERAMLRQIEADLEQRKNRYSSDGWDTATDAVDDYRQLLDELSTRIDDLADDYHQWPSEIDHIITDIYFELSYMRASDD